MLKLKKSTVRESTIEAYLVKEIKTVGGIAYKFTSPQRRSVPDRVCVLPYGLVIFVECKAPGKVPTTGQEREMARLTQRFHSVFIVDSHESVDQLVTVVKNRLEMAEKGIIK